LFDTEHFVLYSTYNTEKEGDEMVSWRTNYDNFEENNQEMKKHVDEMYKLVNNYANKNRITLAYDDTAERFVEAIATYIVNSQVQVTQQ
jgi:hypothetical protein